MKYIITESQYNNLNTPDLIRLRRRLNIDTLKQYFNEFYLDACDYNDVGDFVSDFCDNMKDVLLEVLDSQNISPKGRDVLYLYLVDQLSELLIKKFKHRKKICK